MKREASLCGALVVDVFLDELDVVERDNPHGVEQWGATAIDAGLLDLASREETPENLFAEVWVVLPVDVAIGLNDTLPRFRCGALRAGDDLLDLILAYFAANDRGDAERDGNSEAMRAHGLIALDLS